MVRAPQPALDSPMPVLPLLPRHIAIIMDGNNRWLKQRGGNGLAGHKAGVDSAKTIIRLCAERGISCLTLFAFSSENWQRPKSEVVGLLNLFTRFLQKKEVQAFNANDICLRFIGNRTNFPLRLQTLMQDAEELTFGNSGLKVIVAADYGGRWDITNAAQQLAFQVSEGTIKPEQIDEDMFASLLASSDLLLPDLCIRTGGEHRISNFLLWQFAYTELYFTNTFWPDFDAIELDKALADFSRRQRRYGKHSSQLDIGTKGV